MVSWTSDFFVILVFLVSQKSERAKKALNMKSLFKKKSHFAVSPAGAVLSYFVLGFWAFFILFPLYWLLTTSFKLPAAVNSGPFFIPFVDFQPSLHAYQYVFGEIWEDTRRLFINTVCVSIISTLISVTLGSTAAYALTRFTYKPKVGTVLVFIGCLILAVVLFALGVPTEIIVVVEDENPRASANLLAIEVRGGETTEPGSYDNEIVALTGGLRCAGGGPKGLIAEGVSLGEAPVVVAAHPGECRRIVRGLFRRLAREMDARKPFGNG